MLKTTIAMGHFDVGIGMYKQLRILLRIVSPFGLQLQVVFFTTEDPKRLPLLPIVIEFVSSSMILNSNYGCLPVSG